MAEIEVQVQEIEEAIWVSTLQDEIHARLGVVVSDPDAKRYLDAARAEVAEIAGPMTARAVDLEEAIVACAVWLVAWREMFLNPVLDRVRDARIEALDRIRPPTPFDVISQRYEDDLIEAAEALIVAEAARRVLDRTEEPTS